MRDAHRPRTRARLSVIYVTLQETTTRTFLDDERLR